LKVSSSSSVLSFAMMFPVLFLSARDRAAY
jgi:hypothetical protein